MTSLTVWFYRHGEVASHRGDVPVTEGGLRDAEAAGERLGDALDAGSQVEFLHAPTQRTLQTLEALRRGIRRTLGSDTATKLGGARVEPALRNPDLYVAGTRVEMVSSPDSLVEQLPSGLLTDDQVEENAFFARFWAQHDRIRVWLDDTDPPGERSADVARRFFTFARSLADVSSERPRHYVCVTHSGPLRAILREYVLAEDPGEPDYVEAVELRFHGTQPPAWRFRDVDATAVG